MVSYSSFLAWRFRKCQISGFKRIHFGIVNYPMTEIVCPFCALPPSRVLGENLHAFWIRDVYPISSGHSLIIPKRHIESFFEATPEERDALLTLLDEAKIDVEKEYQPDGYNIGINDGTAAGQTVPHLHIHLIPRFHGDIKDPRGGVRWLISAKADYWSQRE